MSVGTSELKLILAAIETKSREFLDYKDDFNWHELIELDRLADLPPEVIGPLTPSLLQLANLATSTSEYPGEMIKLVIDELTFGDLKDQFGDYFINKYQSHNRPKDRPNISSVARTIPEAVLVLVGAKIQT